MLDEARWHINKLSWEFLSKQSLTIHICAMHAIPMTMMAIDKVNLCRLHESVEAKSETINIVWETSLKNRSNKKRAFFSKNNQKRIMNWNSHLKNVHRLHDIMEKTLTDDERNISKGNFSVCSCIISTWGMSSRKKVRVS